MPRQFICALSITGLLSLGFAPAPWASASAADTADTADSAEVQTVLVIGQFRAAALEQLPVSVSVVGSEQMAARQAQHLEQLTALTPNLNHAAGASRGRYFQLRGIGERSEFREPINASVGLLIDGVDFSGIAGAGTLYDMAQMEVHRGPQGTRFGASGLAGVINLYSQAPTPQFSLGMRTRVANYNSLGLAGFVSGPASDTLGYRFAVEQYRSDGFIKNDYLGRTDTGSFDERSLRGRLRWQPAADLQVDLIAGQIQVENGYDAFSLHNTRRTVSDEPGRDDQRSNYLALNSSWQFAAGISLQSLLSHSNTHVRYGYDEDWVYQGFDPAGYSSTDLYRRNQDRTSAELRLLSTPEGVVFGGRTHWVMGLYWYDQDVTLVRDPPSRTPFDSRYQVRREAVYAQLEQRFSEQLGASAGARYERHRADYADSNALDFSPQDNLVGAHLALDYALESALLYASYSRGYKVGGFNLSGSLQEELRHYDPEYLYNSELGIKHRALQGALQSRLALFHMRRQDAQLGTSLILDNEGVPEFVSFKGNTGSGSRNYGAEAELFWQARPRLAFSAALGLLNARYGSYVNAAGTDLTGRRQPHAPKYQFHGAAEYNLTQHWRLRLEVEGRDAFYFSDSHNQKSEAYELLHLLLHWQQDNWSLQFWGRNLLGEDYAVRGFYFGNNPRTGYAPETYVQLGEPRRVGMTLDWHL